MNEARIIELLKAIYTAERAGFAANWKNAGSRTAA